LPYDRGRKKRGNSMFNLVKWLVEKYRKKPLPEFMSPYDLLTGTLDMIPNIFMALKFNLRHKKYEDMYNKELIEEPECLDSNDEYHEFDKNRILYVVELSNCMICKYERVKLFSFGCTIGLCMHKSHDCNSYKLTDATTQCSLEQSIYYELEALERWKHREIEENSST